LAGIGWDWLGLAGIGWDWLGLAGIGWDWLGLAGIGLEVLNITIYVEKWRIGVAKWCMVGRNITKNYYLLS
jgi:hypothetical protein